MPSFEARYICMTNAIQQCECTDDKRIIVVSGVLSTCS